MKVPPLPVRRQWYVGLAPGRHRHRLLLSQRHTYVYKLAAKPLFVRFFFCFPFLPLLDHVDHSHPDVQDEPSFNDAEFFLPEEKYADDDDDVGDGGLLDGSDITVQGRQLSDNVGMQSNE